MATPVCNRPFQVEKFVCVEIPLIGKGAVGQEEGGGCSAFTKPMLIEPEGADAKEREKNFELLKAELEQALAKR
ncbi:MAG TPA: hypothetical protein VKM72_08705 [Thermoanaerobaculia bacterium]|nr:hypothetical protein [Thermoanaerobaculia bacterium]